MKENSIKISYLQALLKINFSFYLFLWVISVIICFITMRNNIFYFPFVIFLWLLLGIGYSVFRWRKKAILIAPLLSVSICAGLTILFATYDNWQAELALNEFIVSTSDGKLLAKFSAPGSIYDELQGDSSKAYEIEYSDRFLGAYEWIVRFENGSAYFLSFKQTSLGHWLVSIEHSD